MTFDPNFTREGFRRSEALELQRETVRFKLTLDQCIAIINKMHSEGKEAAAQDLRSAGVPIVTDVGRMGTAKFTRWLLKGHVIMCE